jgi:hypothetical protein
MPGLIRIGRPVDVRDRVAQSALHELKRLDRVQSNGFGYILKAFGGSLDGHDRNVPSARVAANGIVSIVEAFGPEDSSSSRDHADLSDSATYSDRAPASIRTSDPIRRQIFFKPIRRQGFDPDGRVGIIRRGKCFHGRRFDDRSTD